MLNALLLHLSAVVREPDARELVLGATAAVRDGEALLLPPGIVMWIKQLQPRLSRRGIQLVDVPMATVDPDTAELVVAEPALPFDGSVLDEIDDGVKLSSELPYVRPGRYPLRSGSSPLPKTSAARSAPPSRSRPPLVRCVG